jgi:hypothetical protein
MDWMGRWVDDQAGTVAVAGWALKPAARPVRARNGMPLSSGAARADLPSYRIYQPPKRAGVS